MYERVRILSPYEKSVTEKPPSLEIIETVNIQPRYSDELFILCSVP